MLKTAYNILVVDDLLDWRTTLSGLLRDDGYKTEAAGSPTTALALLEKKSFHLAIIDLRLDESNEDDEGGLDLTVEIKQRWPETKVIIITGYGTSQRIQRAIQPDITTRKTLADDYIPKTETDKLTSIIQKILTKESMDA